MAFKKTFVLSDESLNSYKFWIPLSGMDLSTIQKNCPLYYEHRTWDIPCGHVENIRLKDSQILGDIVIEGGNDIEKQYIRKIENGDIKGCSLGIDPIEWSEDPKLLKPGQTRATLTKCTPYEVSLAPLPGNSNALALRNENNVITLSAEKVYDFIPDINTKIDMKKIALSLGLVETATEEQIIAAFGNINLKAQSLENLQKVVDTMGEKLPEPQKKFFVSLSKTDMAAAIEFLELHAPVAEATATVEKKDIKIIELIKPGAEKVVDLKDGKDSFDYLQRHDSVKLGKIKVEDPEKYAQLVKDYASGVRYTGK